jgi:phosphoheptose isomerase
MSGKLGSHGDRSEEAPPSPETLLRPAVAPVRRQREGHAAGMVANMAAVVGGLNANDLTLLSELIGHRFLNGRTVIILGNGGSCATASHMATDLTLLARAARLRASVLALHDNPSVVSAMINDYGFHDSGAALVEVSASHGDLLILFSCSGSSPNIVSAAQRAAALGMSTVLVGSRLAPSDFPADHLLLVPSDDYSVIESAHLVVVHVVLDLLRARLGLVSARHPAAAALPAVT